MKTVIVLTDSLGQPFWVDYTSANMEAYSDKDCDVVELTDLDYSLLKEGKLTASDILYDH